MAAHRDPARRDHVDAGAGAAADVAGRRVPRAADVVVGDGEHLVAGDKLGLGCDSAERRREVGIRQAAGSGEGKRQRPGKTQLGGRIAGRGEGPPQQVQAVGRRNHGHQLLSAARDRNVAAGKCMARGRKRDGPGDIARGVEGGNAALHDDGGLPNEEGLVDDDAFLRVNADQACGEQVVTAHGNLSPSPVLGGSGGSAMVDHAKRGAGNHLDGQHGPPHAQTCVDRVELICCGRGSAGRRCSETERPGRALFEQHIAAGGKGQAGHEPQLLWQAPPGDPLSGAIMHVDLAAVQDGDCVTVSSGAEPGASGRNRKAADLAKLPVHLDDGATDGVQEKHAAAARRQCLRTIAAVRGLEELHLAARLAPGDEAMRRWLTREGRHRGGAGGGREGEADDPIFHESSAHGSAPERRSHHCAQCCKNHASRRRASGPAHPEKMAVPSRWRQPG
ncbi:MAG: hypothetical protein HYV63_02065 [Candidatus Schekmanbacteria bacterium]|nr:hypothetical protein [Candidatus Schekmanbacteria bacterium]